MYTILKWYRLSFIKLFFIGENMRIQITLLTLFISLFFFVSCDTDENKCTDALGFAKVVCEGVEVCEPDTGKCIDKCKDTVCEDGISCNR